MKATFSRISWSLPVAVVLLAATVPVTLHLSPIYVSAVTATVLIGLAVTNWATWRRNPREPLPPAVPARSHPS